MSATEKNPFKSQASLSQQCDPRHQQQEAPNLLSVLVTLHSTVQALRTRSQAWDRGVDVSFVPELLSSPPQLQPLQRACVRRFHTQQSRLHRAATVSRQIADYWQKQHTHSAWKSRVVASAVSQFWNGCAQRLNVAPDSLVFRAAYVSTAPVDLRERHRRRIASTAGMVPVPAPTPEDVAHTVTVNALTVAFGTQRPPSAWWPSNQPTGGAPLRAPVNSYGRQYLTQLLEPVAAAAPRYTGDDPGAPATAASAPENRGFSNEPCGLNRACLVSLNTRPGLCRHADADFPRVSSRALGRRTAPGPKGSLGELWRIQDLTGLPVDKPPLIHAAAVAVPTKQRQLVECFTVGAPSIQATAPASAGFGGRTDAKAIDVWMPDLGIVTNPTQASSILGVHSKLTTLDSMLLAAGLLVNLNSAADSRCSLRSLVFISRLSSASSLRVPSRPQLDIAGEGFDVDETAVPNGVVVPVGVAQEFAIYLILKTPLADEWASRVRLAGMRFRRDQATLELIPSTDADVEPAVAVTVPGECLQFLLRRFLKDRRRTKLPVAAVGQPSTPPSKSDRFSLERALAYSASGAQSKTAGAPGYSRAQIMASLLPLWACHLRADAAGLHLWEMSAVILATLFQVLGPTVTSGRMPNSASDVLAALAVSLKATETQFLFARRVRALPSHETVTGETRGGPWNITVPLGTAETLSVCQAQWSMPTMASIKSAARPLRRIEVSWDAAEEWFLWTTIKRQAGGIAEWLKWSPKENADDYLPELVGCARRLTNGIKSPECVANTSWHHINWEFIATSVNGSLAPFERARSPEACEAKFQALLCEYLCSVQQISPPPPGQLDWDTTVCPEWELQLLRRLQDPTANPPSTSPQPVVLRTLRRPDGSRVQAIVVDCELEGAAAAMPSLTSVDDAYDFVRSQMEPGESLETAATRVVVNKTLREVLVEYGACRAEWDPVDEWLQYWLSTNNGSAQKLPTGPTEWRRLFDFIASPAVRPSQPLCLPRIMWARAFDLNVAYLQFCKAWDEFKVQGAVSAVALAILENPKPWQQLKPLENPPQLPAGWASQAAYQAHTKQFFVAAATAENRARRHALLTEWIHRGILCTQLERLVPSLHALHTNTIRRRIEHSAGSYHDNFVIDRPLRVHVQCSPSCVPIVRAVRDQLAADQGGLASQVAGLTDRSGEGTTGAQSNILLTSIMQYHRFLLPRHPSQIVDLGEPLLQPESRQRLAGLWWGLATLKSCKSPATEVASIPCLSEIVSERLLRLSLLSQAGRTCAHQLAGRSPLNQLLSPTRCPQCCLDKPPLWRSSLCLEAAPLPALRVRHATVIRRETEPTARGGLSADTQGIWAEDTRSSISRSRAEFAEAVEGVHPKHPRSQRGRSAVTARTRAVAQQQYSMTMQPPHYTAPHGQPVGYQPVGPTGTMQPFRLAPGPVRYGPQGVMWQPSHPPPHMVPPHGILRPPSMPPGQYYPHMMQPTQPQPHAFAPGYDDVFARSRMGYTPPPWAGQPPSQPFPMGSDTSRYIHWLPQKRQG